jgi:hypothetical protein
LKVGYIGLTKQTEMLFCKEPREVGVTCSGTQFRQHIDLVAYLLLLRHWQFEGKAATCCLHYGSAFALQVLCTIYMILKM